jgi:hypothetical protein
MEESWLLRTASYVELNRVKARMVEHAWDYPWSSVHAYLSGKDDLDLIKTEKTAESSGRLEKLLTGITTSKN